MSSFNDEIDSCRIKLKKLDTNNYYPCKINILNIVDNHLIKMEEGLLMYTHNENSDPMYSSYWFIYSNSLYLNGSIGYKKISKFKYSWVIVSRNEFFLSKSGYYFTLDITSMFLF